MGHRSGFEGEWRGGLVDEIIDRRTSDPEQGLSTHQES